MLKTGILYIYMYLKAMKLGKPGRIIEVPVVIGSACPHSVDTLFRGAG